jgi:hypothetical protein
MHGNFMQACQLGSAPPPLTGNDLIGIDRTGYSAHDDRLNDAALTHGVREFLEVLFPERPTRIARIGPHEFDRDLPRRPQPVNGCRFLANIADESRKPPAKALTHRLFRHDILLGIAAEQLSVSIRLRIEFD